MKKLMCSLLIIISLSLCFTFSGCDNNNYNIKDFYTAYQNIGNNAKNLTLTEADDLYQLGGNAYKIDIDYSKSNTLLNLVNNSSTQYYQLKYFYQQLLDDSLSPLYFFGNSISTSKKISNKKTKQLFEGLSKLEQEYQDIDYYVGILINSLEATDDSNINSSNLKKVFQQYEDAITQANNLSTIVCDVYFNSVLSNSNYNYSAKTSDQLNDADLTRITIDTKARMYYYKSVYANVYNQLYVRGNNLAETLSTSTSITLPTYTPYTFAKNISSLSSKSLDNLNANKQKIYNNAVSLYNIQKSFEKAYKNFNIATSKTIYNKLNSSSSNNEQNYGAIITQFSNGIAYDSYEILNNLVNLLYQ